MRRSIVLSTLVIGAAGGKILCVDACTSFWHPLVASSADARQAARELDAKLGVVKRPDGERQLTFDGLPLYTFAEEGAGKLEGDGFVDDFHGIVVLALDPGHVRTTGLQLRRDLLLGNPAALA